MFRKLALTAAVAVGLLASTAAPAQAWTYNYGGDVYVNRTSEVGVYVWNRSNNSRFLYVGESTQSYVSMRDDVQQFMLPKNCKGRSQYSPAGTYPYQPWTLYEMSRNDLNLSIGTSCYH